MRDHLTLTGLAEHLKENRESWERKRGMGGRKEEEEKLEEEKPPAA